MWNIPLLPTQASDFARDLDTLVLALTALAIFFTLAVTFVGAFFLVRYRKGSDADRVIRNPNSMILEVTWTVIPTILALAIFVWSTLLFFQFKQVPENALEIQPPTELTEIEST